MPLPKLRFSVRGMMVLVAVASLVLYRESVRRRDAIHRLGKPYQAEALYHREQALMFREACKKNWPYVLWGPDHDPIARTPTLRLKWAEYHEHLWKKYEAATSHPWEPIPSDPPWPELLPLKHEF